MNSKQSFAGLDKSRNAGSFRAIFGTSEVTTVYDDDDDGDDDVNCFASVLQPCCKLGLNTFLHREPETG